MPCAPAPYCAAPGGVLTRKVLVTEYTPQQYEATRTVYKTEYKEEKFTAYRCEVVPQERTRQVTSYKMVPVTRDQVVTRYECVPVEEERSVVRNVVTSKPVTQMVTRCVDAGGRYECREVSCGAMSPGCGRRGLFRRRSACVDACAPATRMVSVYVPNYVTEQVPVTAVRHVVEQVSEKVKVTVYKPVARQETLKVTTYQCVPETREVKETVYVTKQVPYEATRKVASCVPVQEKVTLTRLVPVTAEKEVTITVGGFCGDCGPVTGCGRRAGGLFRRGCR
jgi:hypothetical protein